MSSHRPGLAVIGVAVALASACPQETGVDGDADAGQHVADAADADRGAADAQRADAQRADAARADGAAGDAATAADALASDVASAADSAAADAVAADAIQDAGPSGEDPLVTEADVSYLGRFRLPAGGSDQDTFAYGGQALAFNSVNGSLFVGCHDWHQKLGEVSIPTPSTASSYASLPEASVLQPCHDVTEGALANLNPGDSNGQKMGGNLVHQGRLITTGWSYYDASCTQALTHGVTSSLTLSQAGDFAGFYAMQGVARARAKGGFMTPVPDAWQGRLGGPALTGLGGTPIISCASSGVSLTAFDPDDVGVEDPIPATTLLEYPDPDGPIADQYFHWLNSAQSRGVAFPAGSRSVIFIGSRGDTRCYGSGADCGDPCSGSQGVHSAPYKARMWAFDALDLEEVKNGQRARDSLEPYATWELPEMGTDCTTVTGAAHDPATDRVYIAPSYGDQPVVYVYQIAVPTS